MNAKELRDLTDEELVQRLREQRVALQTLRMQMVTGVVDNVCGVRNTRREIARIRTILRERELAAAGEVK